MRPTTSFVLLRLAGTIAGSHDANKHLLFNHSLNWRKSAVQGKRTAPFFISTKYNKEGNRIIQLHQDGSKGKPLSRLAVNLPRTVLSATNAAEASVPLPPAVCVVPVRMQEAWLLFDETAIRKAAGNPLGRQPLKLPDLSKLEDQPDPKTILYELLREASGLGSKRRNKLKVEEIVHRVADLIDDFSPLRALPAFMALEQEIKQVIQERSWGGE